MLLAAWRQLVADTGGSPTDCCRRAALAFTAVIGGVVPCQSPTGLPTKDATAQGDIQATLSTTGPTSGSPFTPAAHRRSAVGISPIAPAVLRDRDQRFYSITASTFFACRRRTRHVRAPRRPWRQHHHQHSHGKLFLLRKDHGESSMRLILSLTHRICLRTSIPSLSEQVYFGDGLRRRDRRGGYFGKHPRICRCPRRRCSPGSSNRHPRTTDHHL